MGFLLKEALKNLCGSNHWCYAVFWKIGHQNPKLLIWEECHYELTQCSVLPRVPPGIDISELLLEEWEQCWVSAESHASQTGFQAGNNIHLLINKMLISNHVIVVGEGLVGRAAFTGNQQWILSENYVRDAHQPEVINEVHQQFSAGMQTVAVIPVLPHGVVQLGSSLPIVENFGFVNEVQRLILQLGYVPGALFMTEESSPKIGVPISIRTSVSMYPSRDYNVINSTSFIADNCNQRSNSPLVSRHAGQFLASLITQNQDSQKTLSLFQTPNVSQTLAVSHDKQSQSKIKPAIKPNCLFRSQLRNGLMGTELITKNSDPWLEKQAFLNNSGSEVRNQAASVQPNADESILRCMEPQLLFDDDVRQHFNSLNASNLPISSHLRADGGLNHNSYMGLATDELHGDGVSNHLGPVLVSSSLSETHGSANVNSLCTNLVANEFQTTKSSQTDVAPVSQTAKQLTTCHLPSGGFDHCQSIDEVANHNDLPARKQPIVHLDESISLIEHFSGVTDLQKYSKENECPRSKNDFYGNAHAGSPRSKNYFFKDARVHHRTGDDLFDVLGLDLKTKLVRGGAGNSFTTDGAEGKTENLGKDTSVPINLKDECSGACLVSEEICKSEIFSGSGTDHLLDAVVSSVHSATRQNSDDNVSCRTTLTNISDSSVPSKSSICDRVIMPNKMQGGLFGLQRPLQKAETVASNSFISGCLKDGAGNTSQTSSAYGSQISSWVEQGHNFNRDSSVSTRCSKRPEEICKSNRKRLKPGESPRPRPKDRQMIQDRVKELREIVPNGAKCSIDALLERTIKHMLFLQSVTKHADKLQQTEESKITSKEGGILLKDNFDGGATWAFEVGSQSMVCPIIVEDLNPPHQMLVEMLCEERGFFLEIADIIRGLGLTILKGVMEVRNDKIWARFAVEANKDITRMDIFMSLVGLLDQTPKSSPWSAKGIDEDDMMVHNSCYEAASIPATSRPGSFQ